MMMVVPGSCFETSRMTGGFDTPHQVGLRARPEHVINGLGGNRTEPLPDRRRNLIGRGVRMIGEPLEHSDSRRGDPEIGRPEALSHGALLVIHDPFSVDRFLE
jgi:hypothetical protein